MKDGLTLKQQRFVDAFIETGNAAEAARRAGYSEKNANRIGAENLSKLVIQKAIEKRLKELEDAKKADINEVLEYFTSVMRGEQTDEVVTSESHRGGVIIPKKMEVRVTTRDRLKAASELMKRFPRALDKEEQRLRLKKLEAEIQETARQDDDVVIIDDWMGDDADEEKGADK